MTMFAAAAIVGGAALGSAAIGAWSSNKASKAQTQAAGQANDLQREMWETQQAQQQPFYESGVEATNKMRTMLGLGPDTASPDYGWANKSFGMNDFIADPGYAFRLSEGMKAMDKTAAARGGLISGQALKAGQRYGQDMASQEYQNAFNRYQINRANRLNPLQSMMGAGQTAANTLSSDASGYGARGGETLLQGGNARASGYMGGANAVAGGVGQYVNYMNNLRMLNAGSPTAGYGGGFAGGTFGMDPSTIPAGFGGVPGGDVWYG